MIVGGIPMLLGGKLPVEISLADNAVLTTNLTTYTFAARAFGAAAGDRLVAVGISGYSQSLTATISSVTIGGVTASLVVSASPAEVDAFASIAAVYIALVPTGLTGDVVVTFGQPQYNCGIAIYRLISTSITAFHTATDNTVTSNAESAALNLIAGGAAIGVFLTEGIAVRTTLWTNLTEQTDRTVEGVVALSTAANLTTTTQTLTVTATASGTLIGAALVLASFRPE